MIKVLKISVNLTNENKKNSIKSSRHTANVTCSASWRIIKHIFPKDQIQPLEISRQDKLFDYFSHT